MSQKRIISANVRGLRDRTMADKIQSLLLYLVEAHVDVACLIDTHLDPQTEHKIESLWDGEVFFAHGEDHQAGIAILTREAHVSDFFNHPSGRFATFKLSLDNRDLLICPVYAPAKRPSERSEFFKLLNAHISSVLKPSEELILLGDFNCAESPDLDRLMPASRMDPSAFEMLRLAASLDV